VGRRKDAKSSINKLLVIRGADPEADMLVKVALLARRGGGTMVEPGPHLSAGAASRREGRVGGSMPALGAAFCGDTKRRPSRRSYPGPERSLHVWQNPSLFFLQAQPMWRIFSLGTRFNASTTPSGFVPGGGAGARALRLVFAGSEHKGPDRVF
jgi:hypothetical protein